MLTVKQNSAVIEVTGASSIADISSVQELWSGYGAIYRVKLCGSQYPSVIVKSVYPSDKVNQPRGWNTDRSHRRKLRSYRVETAWYRNWANQTNHDCRVARPLHIDGSTSPVSTSPFSTSPNRAEDFFFILEDLDAAGFVRRCRHLNLEQVRVGLRWLANFHATFMGCEPSALWPVGTYWHLATRPDEFDAMKTDDPLRAAAKHLDQLLTSARYQSFVHGDAKVANFCFADDMQDVAAVDFQYVGGGCGMKDFAYFLGSCLSEDECEQHAFDLLDDYFAMLREAIAPDINATELETEWRELFPVAWADFNRFLIGWCPGHQKLHRFSEAMTRQALR